MINWLAVSSLWLLSLCLFGNADWLTLVAIQFLAAGCLGVCLGEVHVIIGWALLSDNYKNIPATFARLSVFLIHLGVLLFLPTIYWKIMIAGVVIGWPAYFMVICTVTFASISKGMKKTRNDFPFGFGN